MHEHMRGQVALAVCVTILCIGGLTLVGLYAAPTQSGEIAPLFSDGSSTALEAQIIRVIVTATPAEDNPLALATPTPLPPCAVLRTPTRNPVRTPTPISVIVGSQIREFVFYQGAATYVRKDAFAPLLLSKLPRPANDNGRGLHWFPTTFQNRAVVDRFVPELVAMHIRWVVVLQGMNDWDLVANDYLIEQLQAVGIMPIVRIVRQVGEMDYRRLGWIVARYRERGVRYFQVFNEPNFDEEWGTEAAHTPEQFATYWAKAAEVVAANGGLPGFAPMAPRLDDSDVVFFTSALQELQRAGRYDLLNLMWIGVHNYGGMTANGFWRYRRYEAAVKQILGASLPIIATEGGLETASATADSIKSMYGFVEREREPYLLAFAPWLIGNGVGGGHDPIWESAAWFVGTLDRVQPRQVVEQVK
ncbi:MAG: hypothetical protein M1132_10455 [Chloroflexi bacterium]|nr:hypothetical protein [Chloroflexota bacterium]MCL5952120.1 hypothetical protein [Chloroflexota bacterium]